MSFNKQITSHVTLKVTKPVRLPQELVDTIIDHVEQELLFACSRVCRQWRARSQSRLLHQVTLKTQPQLSQFVSKFLPEASPSLSHIHILTLNPVYRRDITISFEHLTVLLDSLFSLHTLNLWDLCLNVNDPPEGSEFTYHRICELNVKDLKVITTWKNGIYTYRPPSMEEWTAFLRIFSSIDKMVFSGSFASHQEGEGVAGLDTKPSPTGAETCRSNFPSINRLEFEEIRSHPLDRHFLHSLRHYHPETSLPKITLYISWVRNVITLQEVLNIAPFTPTVRVLCIRMREFMWESQLKDSRQLRLPSSLNLDELTIESSITSSIDASTWTMAALNAIISGASPVRRLQTLRLVIQLSYAALEYLGKLDWASLERNALACNGLSSMLIQLRPTYPDYNEHFSKLIQRSLPVLHQSGQLTIERCYRGD